MFPERQVRVTFAAVVATFVLCGVGSYAQPNPYRDLGEWAKAPEGRVWGAMISINIAPNGHLWIMERCGANNCAESNLAPVLEFDQSGKLLNSFGAGMFVYPHGVYIDKDGNVWTTDAEGRPGKGHVVVKWSPQGKILMMLGKPGVAGKGPDTFDQPAAVVTSPSGEIFVADGHGGGNEDSNSRIVKLSRDGKFIKAWGKRGSGPGEFDNMHAIAMDSRGRLYVADRGNNRVQIFDQEGAFLAEWKQFSRPSGIFIDKNDNVYVSDPLSNDTTNPGWERGIRIGSARDGIVSAFIRGPQPTTPRTAAVGVEGVAVDASGNIYAVEATGKMARKFVRN
jgi:DNA-binding beta-propeller fold protein YncE